MFVVPDEFKTIFYNKIADEIITFYEATTQFNNGAGVGNISTDIDDTVEEFVNNICRKIGIEAVLGQVKEEE